MSTFNQIKITSSGDTITFIPQEYRIDYDSLAGQDSGRLASGKMTVNWILRKIVKLTITLPPHLSNDIKYSTILSLIQGQVFTVQYYDYLSHTTKSEQFYCSKTSAGYYFMGMLTDVSFELTAIDGLATVPHVDLTEYTVTWKNWDNTTLLTQTVIGGDTPTYTGATPTRPATAQYTYTFSGWSPTPGPISANTTYTAQFTSTTNQYTITTTAGANGTVTGGGTYNYGTSVTLTASPNQGYVFEEWNDGSTTNPRTITVTENATYSCTFVEGTTPTWTIVFTDYISNSNEGSEDEEENVDQYDVRGESVSFPFTSNGQSFTGIHADSASEDFLYYMISGGTSTEVYDYQDGWSNNNYKTIVTTVDPSTIFIDQDWGEWFSDNTASVTPNNQ